MTRRLWILSSLAGLLMACSGSPKNAMPVVQGNLTARLMRIDPTEQNEKSARGLFVVRVQNETVEAVTVKKVTLEVNFSDDLSAAPAEPDEPSMGAPEDTEDGEPADGSGGDDTYEVTVFEGQLSPGKIVAAGTYEDFPVPVQLGYPEDSASYVAFCKLGIVHLDVEGVVETSQGTLTLADDGEMPTPSLPEPQAAEVQIATTGGGESGDMSMVLRVFNANVFPFKLKDWRYKVYINGKLMREATVGLGERIQSNTAIQYDIGIPLTEKTYGPEIKTLLNGQAVPYRVVGELRFLDISIPTDVSGEVTFSR